MDLFAEGLPLPNCPFCGTAYTEAGKERIERNQKNEEVLHVTCVSCARALVMAVTRTATRLRSVGIITDCNARDYRRFCKGHRVTLDDVLKVHEGLQS